MRFECYFTGSVFNTSLPPFWVKGFGGDIIHTHTKNLKDPVYSAYHEEALLI